MIDANEVRKFFKAWKHYCESHVCDKCMFAGHAICVPDIKDAEIDQIIEWAMENPPLRNPTWREWQRQKFPLFKQTLCPQFICNIDCPHDDILCDECIDRVMSDENFEALGGKKVPEE